MKNTYKIIAGVITIILMLTIVIFNHSSKASKLFQSETVKIGAALGLTGDASTWAEMSLKGAQMAVDELNTKGGINGNKIELVVEFTCKSEIALFETLPIINLLLIKLLPVVFKDNLIFSSIPFDAYPFI